MNLGQSVKTSIYIQLINFIILLLLSKIALGQDIKVLEPTVGKKLDFSPEFISKFNSPESFEKCQELWQKIEDEGRDETQIKPEEQEILNYCSETKENAWEIIGEECSWYCGGGSKEVTASSFLKGQGDNTYEPENAHDLNYKTVWAEGVPGYGIGEYLLYHFAPESPRITKIIVANGYVKSQSAWEKNSRVKQLKMYLDEKPYAILNLKDIRAEQSFDVDTIGNSDRENLDKLRAKPEWTIKFEILDVYKGSKYDDVVISEIYFDGIDVHCLAKGTKINMADGTLKNIEDLVLGDKILTYCDEKNSFSISTIEKLEKIRHINLVKYIFENGVEIITTQDHPFKIESKEWASFKPEKSKQYEGFEKITQINISDNFLFLNTTSDLTTVKLIKIQVLKDIQETYTISILDSGDNFIANGFIVGVEELNDEK
jgi:hypothetical protein